MIYWELHVSDYIYKTLFNIGIGLNTVCTLQMGPTNNVGKK